MRYRQQSSFWNWILFFVKRNTSHKSCHSFFRHSFMSPQSAQKPSISTGQLYINIYIYIYINWTKKYLTGPCNYFMLIWFTNAYTLPLHICFQFFWKKIFFCCTSEMALKCAFLHLQSWNLVQMKANKILFILAFFSMP